MACILHFLLIKKWSCQYKTEKFCSMIIKQRNVRVQLNRIRGTVDHSKYAKDICKRLLEEYRHYFMSLGKISGQ